MGSERRQLVRFLFLKVDPAWRRLDADVQIAHKEEFGATLNGFHQRLLLRTYSTMGTRGDCDFLLWHAAETLETLQALETAVFSTKLGGHLDTAYSYLGMTRKSIYEFPDDPEGDKRTIVRPADNKYLFVYPFVKTRDWWSLSFEKRQEAMNEHVTVGRKYPKIRLNTSYSFGLDDQEFIVAFEGDDPAEFLDLVMELRGSISSRYTERDVPVFTAVQMSLWDMLDALGGSSMTTQPRHEGDLSGGMVMVARMPDLPPGTSKRAYLGSEAIALFNVNGKVYAVSDRCTHGRASLSEGQVDPETCILQCPWHGGKFQLDTGIPSGSPAKVPIKTYKVEMSGEEILVGWM